MGFAANTLAMSCLAVLLLWGAEVEGSFKSFKSSKLASVDALEALRDQTGAQVEQLNQTLSDLTGTVDSLLDGLDSALDFLREPGSPIVPILTAYGSRRRLCEVNSIVEVAELCRFLGFWIPDPFFFHIPCDDPVLGPSACPQGSDYFNLEPGCLTPNRDVDFLSCFVDPPPGATCKNIVIISCTGYTTRVRTTANLQAMYMSDI